MSVLNIRKFPSEDYQYILNNIKKNLENALESECIDDFPESLFDKKTYELKNISLQVYNEFGLQKQKQKRGPTGH